MRHKTRRLIAVAAITLVSLGATFASTTSHGSNGTLANIQAKPITHMLAGPTGSGGGP